MKVIRYYLKKYEYLKIQLYSTAVQYLFRGGPCGLRQLECWGRDGRGG